MDESFFPRRLDDGRVPTEPGSGTWYLVARAAPVGCGSGKGLLARCICIIAFGREPHAVTAGANTEEVEKRIASELIEASPVLFLDNLNNTTFKSDLAGERHDGKAGAHTFARQIPDGDVERLGIRGLDRQRPIGIGGPGAPFYCH